MVSYIEDAFHSAEETWVQWVIAECMTPCFCFLDVGQDDLGRDVLESSPSCYRFASAPAVHDSILVKPFRQRHCWNATLITPVMHGFNLLSCYDAQWSTPQKRHRLLLSSTACSTWKEPGRHE